MIKPEFLFWILCSSYSNMVPLNEVLINPGEHSELNRLILLPDSFLMKPHFPLHPSPPKFCFLPFFLPPYLPPSFPFIFPAFFSLFLSWFLEILLDPLKLLSSLSFEPTQGVLWFSGHSTYSTKVLYLYVRLLGRAYVLLMFLSFPCCKYNGT